MKWPHFAIRLRLSKLALVVAGLAVIKLALLLVMGIGQPAAVTPGAKTQVARDVAASAPAPSPARHDPAAQVTGALSGQGNRGPQTPRKAFLDDTAAHAAQQDQNASQEKKPQSPAPAQPESVLTAQQLKTRAEALDRQEQALKELESGLNTRLAKLQELETMLKGMLTEAKTMKDEKLRHLIDVYGNMKAKQAAQVLETLDENIAVKILAGMKGRQAGEILTNVNAKKAAKLSEELTKLQVGQPLPDAP